jgi:glycosidase
MSQPGVTVKDLKLAFGIVLTMRGTPEIYYGDELAMTGGPDPNNRHDFPGGFPGDKQDAFTAAGRTPVENEVHDWVEGLLRFRDSQPVFGDGGQQDLTHNATTLVYLRARDLNEGCGTGDADRVLVAVNDGDKAETLKIDPADTALTGCKHFVSEAGTHVPASLRGGKVRMMLGPKQMAIYKVR